MHSQPAAAAAKAVVQFAGLPHVAAPAATAAHPGQLHFSLNTSKRITKRQPKLPFSLSIFSEASLSLAKLPASAQSFYHFFYVSQTIICSCHLPLADLQQCLGRLLAFLVIEKLFAAACKFALPKMLEI